MSLFDKKLPIWYIYAALKGKSIQNIYSSELGTVGTNNKYLGKEHPGANYRKEKS